MGNSDKAVPHLLASLLGVETLPPTGPLGAALGSQVPSQSLGLGERYPHCPHF